MCAPDRRPILVVLLVLGVLVGLLPSAAAHAQCGYSPDRTPFEAVDDQLWGALRPLESSLPRERDSTSFDRNRAYTTRDPLYQALDVGGGYLFAGFNLGIKAFAINADGTLGGGQMTTLDTIPIQGFNPHDYFRVKDVDASPDGSLLTMTGHGDLGLTLWEVQSAGRLRLLYQDGGDAGKYGEDVFVTKINGVHYGFLAAQKSSTFRGVHAYNLDLAANQGASGACIEQWPSDVNCGGAHVARLTDVDSAHLDGAGNDAQGHFLATSKGSFGNGVTLWRVSNPASPQKLFEDLPTRKVQGLAMWEWQGRLYLAMTVRTPDEARIYDVTCLRTGSCSSLGNPIASFPITGWATSSWPNVTHSVSNGSSYLYIGQKYVYSLSVLQAEWLLDVSTPSEPVDVLGGDLQNGGVGQPTMTASGKQVGYWSWYYSCHPSGSNWIEPNDGIVHNGKLYRSATAILDVHEVGETTPRIQVTGAAAETYEGLPLAFSAAAFNCTPSPTGWSWTATGGGVVSGSGASRTVTWPSDSAGTWSVSATNSSCPGADVETAAVTVRDAEPVIGSVTPNVSSALACSPVTFTASGVTGRPPLSYTWQILDPQGAPLASPTLALSNGNQTATWNTAADSLPLPLDGSPVSYKARLTLTNGTTPATQDSALVAISSPGTPGFTGPVGAAVSFGTVDFSANSTGATEWRWTFDDGDVLTTQDPVLGPAPQHVYDAVGTYDVTVEVRNCQATTWVPNALKQVVISEVNPLVINSFQAKGSFGYYIYDTGDPILFSHDVEGDPDFYDYDWDGNGSFEDAGNTSPRATHAYGDAGDYRPVLRVRRGGAEKTFTHLQALQVSAVNRSVSVSGPGSGKVGVSYTFTASASGCAPGSTGWNWSASGGGSVSGSGSSVQVSWASTGTKIVQASHTACGSTQGSRSISITSNSTPPPPNLEASFTVSPLVPKTGQQVVFDAGASTGSPTGYSWTIDGKSLSGKQVTYTFDDPGSYQVELEVGKPGDACSFRYCTDSTTKTVTVQPGLVTPPIGDNGCTGELADDLETLCLGDGRFQLQVDWTNPHNNNAQGTGKALSLEGSERTGFFYFFNQDNVELIVKILDGADVNGHIWVFYGSLTDVAFDLTVTDTVLEKTKLYENLAGSQCGLGDNIAFPVATGEATAALASGAGTTGILSFPGESARVTGEAFRPGIEDDPETLVLWDGRFEVEVDFVNQHNADTPGTAKAIPGTKKSGYFWFFRDDNLELAVKIIDGRPVNGKWWVFWGGLSDLKYSIRVRDTTTDEVWTSPQNPAGSVCGGNDLSAL